MQREALSPAMNDGISGARLLLDLTTAYIWRGRRAVGIIRTEREIAIRLLRDPSLTVLPFIFHGGKLRALDPGFALSMLTESPPLTSSFPEGVSPVASTIDVNRGRHGIAVPPVRVRFRRSVTSAARACARAILRRLPERARDDVALSMVHFRSAVRQMVYSRAGGAAGPPPPSDAVMRYSPSTLGLPPAGPVQPDLSLVVHPRSGDILFTCGLGWSDFDWELIANLRESQQIRVVCMVYDIIPILYPNWIPAKIDVYLAHFLSVIDSADEIPCISRCTERDVQEFAQQNGRAVPSTHVVYLGADLPDAANAAGLGSEIEAKLADGRFALSVGTFEIRKNYSLLLDVWDRLVVDSDFDLDLVIVGMRGWKAEDVIERLEASPLYGRRIIWLSNLDDGSLSWLYERCHVVLYPSLYEGWGLPVVEGLQHRRPVICSNRGAVPEAGMGVAQSIDPDDLEGWCEAVAAIARSPRTQSPLVSPPSWDDTAGAIRSIILKAAGAERSHAA